VSIVKLLKLTAVKQYIAANTTKTYQPF